VSSQSEFVLRATRLSKTYFEPRPLTVFENLSLEIRKGEFVALLGRSGCGKTTLLRTLAGLEAPTGGVVQVAGDDRPHSVAMVFQEPSLLPWRSVAKNILLPALLLSEPIPHERLTFLLEICGLANFADYFPHQISGGMQSRTAIARALLPRPKILLMDEPFGSLDEVTRDRLQSELLDIWEKLGTSILLVTHSVEEAVFLADRVLVMNGSSSQPLTEVPISLKRPRPRAYSTSSTLLPELERLRRML